MSAPDAAERLSLAVIWLFVLNAYGFLLAASVGLVGHSSLGYWSVGALAVALAALTVALARKPAAFYGLTWRGARRALGGMVLATGLLALLGAIALAALGYADALPPGVPLFAWQGDVELVAYVLVAAPLQELLFRGLFQSSARYILGERPGAAAWAVAFSTVAYCASHLPWGLTTALAMAVPGLVWGWRFEKERTLLGVVLSHVLVGYLFVGATPLWAFFRADAP